MQRTTLDKSNNGWTELIFLREKMWIFDLVLNTLTTYHLVGPYQYISTVKNIQRQCLKTIIYIFGLFATIPHFWSSQSHVIPVLGLNCQQHVGSLHPIIISTTGALRIGAVREPSYHPSTYSFWAFKPVYTKSFWPWVPTFNELGLSLSAVEREKGSWNEDMSWVAPMFAFWNTSVSWQTCLPYGYQLRGSRWSWPCSLQAGTTCRACRDAFSQSLAVCGSLHSLPLHPLPLHPLP